MKLFSMTRKLGACSRGVGTSEKVVVVMPQVALFPNSLVPDGRDMYCYGA